MKRSAPSPMASPLQAVLDLLYPRNCVHTGRAVDGSSPYLWLCSEAAKEIVFLEPPCCSRCGFSFAPAEEGRPCPHCLDLRPSFESARAVVHYDGPARTLLQQFKYGGARHLVRDLVSMVRLSPTLPAWMEGLPFVPVPLHTRKLRERGFNQAELIAEALGHAFGNPVCALLRRVRDTDTQTHLDREDRRENVRGAFELLARAPKIPPAVILIDDVFTTGSTLDACSRTLLQSGVRRVKVLALAHG